ncbi:MAG TPA: hypothetical protein VFF21_06500 [Flavobacteriaceae bacterium]|nr:hypothetical protein [Flavobacteriaceae bacterium]
MKKIILLSFLLLSFTVFSQEEEVSYASSSGSGKSIRPLRVGLKLGVPSFGTFNAEYVTPLLEDRVAASIDYMPLNITFGDQKLNISAVEFGSNIYFSANKGRGFYGGLSYFSFNSDLTWSDIDFDNGTTGDGMARFKYSTFNVKLGVKLGRTFYFRSEVGYGFGKVGDKIVLTGGPGQVATEDLPPIPGMGASGVLVFNIGFGVGFL